jgi:phage-related protein
MGIYLVKMNSGFMESQFFGERQLKSDTISGRRTPYYYGDEVQPLKIKLQLSPLGDKWTPELKDNVTRWLNNGKFNKFFSYDDPNRIYYLTYVGSPTLNVTGQNQGYIEIEFQNIDCYVRSNVESTQFDLSGITSPAIVEVLNLGNETILPDIYITKKTENGSVSICNLSNGGLTSTVTGLFIDEELTLDGENRKIITANPNLYRYDTFNKTYMRLVYGVNRLQITGKCHLKINFRQLFRSE